MAEAFFRNVCYLYDDNRHTENGPIKRIHFSADYSSSLIDEMNGKGGKTGEIREGGLGWIALPASMPSCKLAGSLVGCTIMMLRPNGNLEKNEIQIDIMDVGDFAVKRIKVGDESTEDKLTFVVRTNSPKAPDICWDFMQIVGKADSLMKVSYDEQMSLPGPDPEESGDGYDGEGEGEGEEGTEGGDPQEVQESLPGVDAPKPRGGKKSKAQQLADAVADEAGASGEIIH